MARPKKISNEVKIGDVVELWSEKDAHGSLMGIGVVDQVMPMAGGQENMIWVRGFAPHDPAAVKRKGSVQELVGQINMLSREVAGKSEEISKLVEEIESQRKQSSKLIRAIEKGSDLVITTDTSEFLDAKNTIKWIRELKNMSQS